MKFWVGVTDKSWFERLRAQGPDEVNFWQPSGKALATFLQPGVPFLFKLHSPDNFIVGGGFFVRFSALPARLAWEAFREKNGVADYDELRRRIERYRGAMKGDPEIGCNILNAPIFLPEEDWIPVPESWAPNIVRGRTFDDGDREGAQLWDAFVARTSKRTPEVLHTAQEPRYGSEYLARARLGQGAFRVLVTEAYGRRCAITGERTLPVLEAAHIKPYAQMGPHIVANGLLLRSDLHILFDDGYLTLDEQLRVVVSRRIREEFENGKEYYAYQGRSASVLPGGSEERPSTDFIRWHNDNIFLGS